MESLLFFSYYIRNIWNTFITQRVEGAIKNLFIRNFWNSIVISGIIKKLLTALRIANICGHSGFKFTFKQIMENVVV